MQPLPPPPGRRPNNESSRNDAPQAAPTRPPLATNPAPQQAATNPEEAPSSTALPPKKRKHRGGKKRRNRRKSFAAPPSDASGIASNMELLDEDDDDATPSALRPGESFYKRKNNRSEESLDSDALLDHRDHQPMRPRRESRLNVLAAQRAGINASFRQNSSERRNHARRRTGERSRQSDDEQDIDSTERTPLMKVPSGHRSPNPDAGYGLFKSRSRNSSRSSGARRRTKSNQGFPGMNYGQSPGYDVNNPPSVPGSPHMQASMEDPMMPETGSFLNRSPDSSRNLRARTMGDVLIEIDRQDALDGDPHSAPPSPRLNPDGIRHKRGMTFEDDVCMPDAMSEMAEDDFDRVGSRDEVTYSERRRRRKEWPKLWVFEEWSREEKELRAADTRRTQRVQEPLYVDGMLRAPRRSAWHREEAPNRFTYFNVELESTIHAPTISELVPPEGDFRELFIPEPPILEDSSSSDTETEQETEKQGTRSTSVLSPKIAPVEDGNNLSRLGSQLGQHRRSRSQDPSKLDATMTNKLPPQSRSVSRSHQNGDGHTPHRSPHPVPHTAQDKPRRYGKRPQFWLDVLCPTPQEMQVMKVAFGIHPLTAEDILQQEAREKVELFRNYYFINYRTFEQDQGSEDFLEPINVYILVFAHGILTFHFSQIPHPANVRRRIRQLQDYLDLSADWISYAIIDDITDVFGPMITNIEQEVDEVDEAVLQSTPGAFAVDSEATGDKEKKDNEKTKNDSESDKSSLFSIPSFLKPGGQKKKDTSGYDMLRRLGESRKKVMSLYRLLSTKADVIKGFGKRCNDQLDLKNEIGLYLGDIQDHILTMTSSLSHYEALLGRAHSNYLAQVSIRMNERSEQTSDILNKLTVFGTIVLPMNIICGMWGMNVKVPGQDIDNLWWFWGITAGLMAFAIGCYLLCRKLYGIV